jgi:predicted component of type VI protein secretion system
VSEADDAGEGGEGREKPIPRQPIDWAGVQEEAVAALAQSKDLRVLAYLGAAVLRTDGLSGFSRVLTTASEWTDARPR